MQLARAVEHRHLGSGAVERAVLPERPQHVGQAGRAEDVDVPGRLAAATEAPGASSIAWCTGPHTPATSRCCCSSATAAVEIRPPATSVRRNTTTTDGDRATRTVPLRGELGPLHGAPRRAWAGHPTGDHLDTARTSLAGAGEEPLLDRDGSRGAARVRRRDPRAPPPRRLRGPDTRHGDSGRAPRRGPGGRVRVPLAGPGRTTVPLTVAAPGSGDGIGRLRHRGCRRRRRPLLRATSPTRQSPGR